MFKETIIFSPHKRKNLNISKNEFLFIIKFQQKN